MNGYADAETDPERRPVELRARSVRLNRRHAQVEVLADERRGRTGGQRAGHTAVVRVPLGENGRPRCPLRHGAFDQV